MTVRTQITFDNDTQKRARRRANELGISMSEYVRQVVTRDLESPGVAAGVTSIFNLGSSGGSNIARNKHAMIAEAIDAAYPRRHPK